MKAFSDLIDSVLEVETEDGILKCVVKDSERGSGSDKYRFTLSVFSSKKPKEFSQCYVEFGGKKYGASFRNVLSGSEFYKSDLLSLISDPDFWV